MVLVRQVGEHRIMSTPFDHPLRSAMRPVWRRIGVVFGVLLILGVAEAHAGPIALNYEYTATFQAAAFADGALVHSPLTTNQGFLDQANLSASVTNTSGAEASYDAEGRVRNGRIGILARTMGDLRSSTLPNGSASAYAIVSQSFVDELVFESDTLPKGTPVSYNFEMRLFGEFALQGWEHPDCSPSSPVVFGGYAILVAHGLSLGMSFCTGGHPLATSIQTYSGVIGEVTPLSARMEVGSIAGACKGISCPPDTLIPYQRQIIDASHTAAFVITVNTPGVTFRSGSGATYTADVPTSAPEPASLLLLGVAVVGAGARRYRPNQG